MVHWVRSIPGKFLWPSFFHPQTGVHPLLQALNRPLKYGSDLKTFLHSLVDLVIKTLEPTGCSVWLRAQADRTAQIVGSGNSGQLSPPLTARLERDWTGTQVCSTQVYPVEEINCPSLKAALEADGVGLIAPLIHQDEVIGWLGLGRPRGRAIYSREEVAFLEVLVRQGAVAVACFQLKLELESYVHQLRRA
jgi:GAF domain-containing protein